jgi:hypothetical protein
MTKSLSRWIQIAVLVIAAMALTYPFIVWGLIPGHDRAPHLEYQHFFNEQIAGGDLYPRWMPGLNQGRGSPIFFVQYPLPYYVAWGLGHLIPNHWKGYTETHTLGLGIALATILGALFVYAWCTTFVDGQSAMLASLVFLTLPYFFSIDLYLRIAVGEFWALTMMPLLFYFLERRSSRPRRAFAGLAVAFTLVLLSHLFTAVLCVVVTLAYAMWRSEPSKRLSAALQTAGALLLGTALAAVYTLTVFAHRHFLHPESMLTLGGANYSPLSQMFPYNASTFPVDTRGWRFLGGAARCMAGAAICLVGYACYELRRERGAYLRIFWAAISILTLGSTILAGHLPGLGEVPGAMSVSHVLVEQRAHIFLGSFLTLEATLLCFWFLPRQIESSLAEFLVGMALLVYLMMTRWSLVVWNNIHPLWSMQFPWRLNVFLTIATTGLAALAISNLGKRPLRERVVFSILAILVWGLVAGGAARAGYVEDTFWETRPVAYEPTLLDPALSVYARVKSLQEALDVKPSKDGNLDVVVTAGTGNAKVRMVNPRLINLYATCETDCTLQIGQFFYPAWRAYLAQGGTEIPLRASSPGGLMEISLHPGASGVVVALPRGWSERIGPWVSLVSLILVVVIARSDKPPVTQRLIAPEPFADTKKVDA